MLVYGFAAKLIGLPGSSDLLGIRAQPKNPQQKALAMIDCHPDSLDETLVIHATGILSSADYETRFVPMVEAKISRHGKINLIMYLDENFEGWDIGAIWDDARFGLKHRHDFKRVAVVGAQVWFKWAYNLGSKFLDGKFHTFDQDDLAGAIAWARVPLPLTETETAGTATEA
jgi:hypothetical protein